MRDDELLSVDEISLRCDLITFTCQFIEKNRRFPRQSPRVSLSAISYNQIETQRSSSTRTMSGMLYPLSRATAPASSSSPFPSR